MSTTEHIDFAVKERAAWETLIKPHLVPDRRRINFEAYREAKRAAAEADRFFCWAGVRFIEPLLPDMVGAGIDCLQVMEVKAGMDPLRIKRDFGDRLSLFGGMDARNLVANDRDAIRKELEEKIPPLMDGFGYILHSDHSILTTTEYETYRSSWMRNCVWARITETGLPRELAHDSTEHHLHPRR